MEMDAEKGCVLTRYSWLPEGLSADQQIARHVREGHSQATLLSHPHLPKGLTQKAIPEGLCLWELETLLERTVLLLKTCQLKCK